MRDAWRLSAALVIALATAAACRGGGARPAGGDGGARPAAPVATPQDFRRDLDVAINFERHTWETFRVRGGARLPLAGFWARYAPYLGVPLSELEPSGPHAFRQVHRGYPVSGYGYTVEVVDGYVQSGTGKAMTGLPDKAPTPIDRARAEAIASARIAGGEALPAGELVWWSGKVDPKGPDFHLVWRFGSLTIDATDGAVLVAAPGAVRN
jgi:hypothetical protein